MSRKFFQQLSDSNIVFLYFAFRYFLRICIRESAKWLFVREHVELHGSSASHTLKVTQLFEFFGSDVHYQKIGWSIFIFSHTHSRYILLISSSPFIFIVLTLFCCLKQKTFAFYTIRAFEAGYMQVLAMQILF